MRRLSGLVIVPVAPMHEDGTVDTERAARQLADLLGGGAEGVFVMGRTGGGLLLDNEQIDPVRTAVEMVREGSRIVAHCGALATAEMGL
ncbi:MAG TPA: dihydrodipicolinate synthase family protein [bacterium]|nr:dihydrodipicolinate synthase family protein [bacterium]